MKILVPILLSIISSVVYHTWGWVAGVGVVAMFGAFWFLLWCFTWFINRRTAIIISNLPPDERQGLLKELEENDQFPKMLKHLKKIEPEHRPYRDNAR